MVPDLDTVLELEIFEVSPCTFPAYPQTEIAARKKDFECLKRANVEALNERKMKIKEEIQSMNKALIMGARMRTKANKVVELEEAITEFERPFCY